VTTADLRSDPAARLALPHLDKGLPLEREETSAVGANMLREDLPLPVCTLRDTALRANSAALPRFLAAVGRETGADVVLAPHGKTTMSPALFRRQLDDGCHGITLATVRQVRVARHFGITRVLLANELVGAREIDWVVAELRRDPAFAFTCLVDSVAGVERLAARAAANPAGRPLDVLVEAGYSGGRCGVRTPDEGVAVARAVRRAAPLLRLAGVEGYEGLLQTSPAEGRDEAAAAVVRFVADLARELDREGLLDDADPVLLSAGGSSFYDLAARILAGPALRRPTRIIVRSGCYLTHDTGLYEPLLARLVERDPLARAEGLGFSPALEVWTSVLSVPEPGLAVLGAGRRDFGEDAGPPRLARHVRDGEELHTPCLAGARIERVSDQHAMVALPECTGLHVGDLVALSPSHPCTTFDKWRAIHVVDDATTVVETVRTYF
jgi:D-serine deaminase-like pyridoxal phosphate-dependent protein